MFTGIIETIGVIQDINQQGSNIRFEIKSSIAEELHVDQSIAHNGVCLTIVDCKKGSYFVDAVEETLKLTNLGDIKQGDGINLERCLQVGARLDGHFVQGHVDSVGVCDNIEQLDGSWYFTFAYDPKFENLLVNKGSITINGVSLTVIKPSKTHFKIAIIPYTFNHTTFGSMKIGDRVNLEFDILGKYILRSLEERKT